MSEASTQVEEQIAIINEYAESVMNEANAALTVLGAQGNVSVTPPTGYGGILLPFFTPIPASPAPAPQVGPSPSPTQFNAPAIPPRPVLPGYSVEKLLAITMPPMPTINIPSLNVTPPVYNISAPKQWTFSIDNVTIGDPDPEVEVALNRLYQNIVYGGTGLTPAIETAIWQRDLERMNQQVMDSTDKVTAMWAKKGFSLPDGQLAHSLSEVQKEFMNRLIDRGREISIKQAELEQKNIFTSLELIANYAKTLYDAKLKYEDLILRVNEDIAKFANEYIDLQIKTYMAQVDAFKTMAQYYEILIRAELAKADLYKAEIEGQIAIGQLNEQTVKIFAEQIQSNLALMEVYKVDVQGMQALLDGEKTKIEINKIQFDAWAKTADVQIATYNGLVDNFKATSQVNVETAQLYNKQYESQAQMAMMSVELTVKSLEVYERNLIAKAQVLMEAARGVAQATSSMAAGAMSAMSAHAGMTYSESMSINPPSATQ